MKEFFLKVGRFFRVIDEYYPILSITNIACIVIITKLAMAAQPSVADLGSLFVALLAYHGKKQLNKQKDTIAEDHAQKIDDLTKKIKEVGDKVGGMAAMIGIKNLNNKQ